MAECDYIIATASTADLPAEFFKEHNVPFISYSYTIDNEVYYDDCREESRERVYKHMRKGAELSTSMINTYDYYEFFKKLMEQGKDVIYLDMTKQLSHSYVNAAEAAGQIREEYPNQRFYVMDTLCVSGGLGLLITYMVRLRDGGSSFDEVTDWAEKHKRNVIHWFTVDDLHYLKRSGRVSNSEAMVGSLLHVKPVLYVDDDGRLTLCNKVRGRKSALLAIIDKMKTDFTEPDGQEVYINHADCIEDAEFVRDRVLENFPSVSRVTITNLGVVIGAHCGPGLFTIFYLGNKRFS